MKFQPETLAGVNTIARHDAGRIVVGPQAYTQGIVVPWVGAVGPWPLSRIDELQPALVEQLAALAPEVVLFGTGSRLRFPPPAMLRPLIERRIGFESMDTAAACRTYNVLVTERRAVVAALILDGAAC
ncbi:MAG: Mth938-like domain-containing protein [Rubrivivax sp.]